jgi:hypothetical protein
MPRLTLRLHSGRTGLRGEAHRNLEAVWQERFRIPESRNSPAGPELLRRGLRTLIPNTLLCTKVKVERGRLLHGAFRQHGTQTASTAAYGETAAQSQKVAAQLCTCT